MDINAPSTRHVAAVKKRGKSSENDGNKLGEAETVRNSHESRPLHEFFPLPSPATNFSTALTNLNANTPKDPGHVNWCVRRRRTGKSACPE